MESHTSLCTLSPKLQSSEAQAEVGAEPHICSFLTFAVCSQSTQVEIPEQEAAHLPSYKPEACNRKPKGL